MAIWIFWDMLVMSVSSLAGNMAMITVSPSVPLHAFSKTHTIFIEPDWAIGHSNLKPEEYCTGLVQV